MCPTVREEDIGKTVENENGDVIGTVAAVEEDTLHVESGDGVLDSIGARLGWKRATEDVLTVSTDAVGSITEDVLELESTPTERGDTDEPTVAEPNREPTASDIADATPELGHGRRDVAERDSAVDTGDSGHESDTDGSEERRELNVPGEGREVNTPDRDVKTSGSRVTAERLDERDVSMGNDPDDVDESSPTKHSDGTGR